MGIAILHNDLMPTTVALFFDEKLAHANARINDPVQFALVRQRGTGHPVWLVPCIE